MADSCIEIIDRTGKTSLPLKDLPYGSYFRRSTSTSDAYATLYVKTTQMATNGMQPCIYFGSMWPDIVHLSTDIEVVEAYSAEVSVELTQIPLESIRDA